MPAFMISELRRAFEIGFLLYLPFVIIDMVIARIYVDGHDDGSAGDHLTTFKLIFFVLVDGRYMVAGSLS